ncbi:hypothetical protein E2C01_056159 [Portunus trituberculatus]|uniref:Uncharacterized protein n=1 Tax=Portunus trituberculatus TaxID=210409 RepID=A0A5B7GX40_PORTR|nr:hypothetical protein [Portunus trituberculatus]
MKSSLFMLWQRSRLHLRPPLDTRAKTNTPLTDSTGHFLYVCAGEALRDQFPAPATHAAGSNTLPRLVQTRLRFRLTLTEKQHVLTAGRGARHGTVSRLESQGSREGDGATHCCKETEKEMD